MIDLNGKVAIVTGAASYHGDPELELPGQGSETARLLASLGASVVLADKAGEAAEKRAGWIRDEGGNAVAVEADVTDEEQVRQMVETAVERFGRLDVLHCNAAELAHLYDPGDPGIVEFTVETWRVVTESMLLGSMLCCKHAIPAMVESGDGGSIVVMTSASSEFGELNLTVYGIAKAAMNQLVRAVSTQWGKEGIRANALAPGMVRTPPSLGAGEDVIAMYERHSNTPYVAEPIDSARIVAFLASDAAKMISGEVVHADGGLVAQSPLAAEARASGQMAGGS